MPVVSRQTRSYANIPSFVTYGATPIYTVTEILNTSRDRTWSRNYKGRKQMMQALLRDGFLPTSPYQDDLQEVVRGKVVELSGQMYSDPSSTYLWTIVPTSSRTSVSTDDAIVSALVADVQASLQSKVSGHGTNLIVSAAEARETVGMIYASAKRLVTAYRHVRKFQFRNAAKVLGLTAPPRHVSRERSVSDNWLEYRYGWRLVVMDVESLLKTLYDSLTQRPPLLRVYAQRGQEAVTKEVATGLYKILPNGMYCISYNRTIEVTRTYKAEGGYTYELQSVPLATGQAFGLTNYAVAAWEFIPASFMVDWALNIGSVLEGLTAFQGKSCKTGFINRIIQSSTIETWTNIAKATGASAVKTVDGLHGSLSLDPIVERRFLRSPMAFTPSSLRLSLDLNVSKVVDLALVMNQLWGPSSKH